MSKSKSEIREILRQLHAGEITLQEAIDLLDCNEEEEGGAETQDAGPPTGGGGKPGGGNP